MSQTFESQRWHQFMIYIAYNVAGFTINSLMNAILPWVTRGACQYSLNIHDEVLMCYSYLVPYRLYGNLHYRPCVFVTEL